MTFIRLKRVGKERYAYLVDNVWTSKGPRQQVKRYLGKYLELPDAPRGSLIHGALPTISLLVGSELRGRGFTEKLSNTELNIRINLKTCTARQGTKNIVLGINGGFLCGYTLRKLIHAVPLVEVVQGYSFARAFSDAGIRVSREEFVVLYRRLQTKPTAA